MRPVFSARIATIPLTLMWEGGSPLLKYILNDHTALWMAQAKRDMLTHVYDHCDLI